MVYEFLRELGLVDTAFHVSMFTKKSLKDVRQNSQPNAYQNETDHWCLIPCNLYSAMHVDASLYIGAQCGRNTVTG